MKKMIFVAGILPFLAFSQNTTVKHTLTDNSGDSDIKLVITEIMYNDPSAYADSLEFIELYNNGGSQVNIGGYSFSKGLEYTFPDTTTIDAGAYLVIAKNNNALNNFFSINGTLQWTSGSLSNSGEKIEITDTEGIVIDSLTYMTSSPWPGSANGNGASLTLCDPSSDNSAGSNWQASVEYTDSLNNKAVRATPGKACALTGIENYTGNNHFFSYFPNPAGEILTIVLNSSKAKEITLYDILGNVVYSTVKPFPVTRINTEKLSKGINIIRIIFNDNTVVTRKIFVI